MANFGSLDFLVAKHFELEELLPYAPQLSKVVRLDEMSEEERGFFLLEFLRVLADRCAARKGDVIPQSLESMEAILREEFSALIRLVADEEDV